MKIQCPFCQKEFEVIPRAAGYAGKTRKTVTCPHCSETYCWTFLPQGPKRPQQIVELVQCANRPAIVLEEYDCSFQEAKRFATHFQAAWFRVPDVARTSILQHWAKAQGSPFIWLLANRQEWGGKGWAATSSDGHSLFVVDSVVNALSGDFLESLIMHEFGHFLFISEGEINHRGGGGPGTLERCEKLVWDVTAAWGINIDDAERWMIQNFEDTAHVLVQRVNPLSQVETEQKFVDGRQNILNVVANFSFPPQYKKFCVKA